MTIYLDSKKTARSFRNINLLPYIAVGALCFSVVSIVLNLVIVGLQVSLINKPSPTLVERNDGISMRVEPIGHLDRQPEAVKNFVAQKMVQLFDWRPYLTDPNLPGEPQLDPGVEIGSEQERITTKTWQAGFGLAAQIRIPYLQMIARLTPDSVFAPEEQQRAQGVLVIERIGQPEKIKANEWKISIVSKLLIFENGDNLGEPIPVNKHVFVRSVTQPILPPDPTPAQQAIAEARKAGMEIYALQDIQ
ncbi:hypothetical protein [Acaryochloris sp. CCMEE 5410]|uniref:hypothetical protein n=1 Tax=Acaryochloris sp. CCMEE 5410 TaxID=310037 RepID=UPI0021CFD310|nr:hypothetical protein [Acaryochloris sp. CCMEE 5410]KAI9130162.1 hypothetical protein ON05_031540 [Acaryochloris sp. CCMEE 5410]